MRFSECNSSDASQLLGSSFLSEELPFASFQTTHGSQTPPVLNLYFLEALFVCSFFTVWFLPLLREPFHVVFPGCVLYISHPNPIRESSHHLSSFFPCGLLGSIFDGLQSLLFPICHRQIDAFSRYSLTGLTPPFSMSFIPLDHLYILARAVISLDVVLGECQGVFSSTRLYRQRH
jgi:hypothetical protein